MQPNYQGPVSVSYWKNCRHGYLHILNHQLKYKRCWDTYFLAPRKSSFARYKKVGIGKPNRRSMSMSFSVVVQPDTVLFNDYEPPFVQVADGLFVTFLALLSPAGKKWLNPFSSRVIVPGTLCPNIDGSRTYAIASISQLGRS